MQTIPVKFLLHPVYSPALGFGVGCSKYAPGTVGTLVGVLFYLPLQYLAWPAYAAVVALLFLAGIYLCGETAGALESHDHPAIVWDEIVGYLATMLLAPSGWIWIVSGFLLFRLFDIWKPWPVRLVDKRMKGGMGIMIDDLIAAVYSWIFLQIIHILYTVSLS
ncbi:MAG: phosphatidylglycerophosphatase A [Gammaproteobacteria bacterium]